MTDQSGAIRTGRTSSFGYYRIEGIAAGQTCVISVRAGKRNGFSSAAQSVVIVGDYDGVNFYADN